jgi:hypothetical protein
MGQAASAAFQSSDGVHFRCPNLPVLNWPFLIFSANSIPLIVIAALSNRLNPSIGRILCFTPLLNVVEACLHRSASEWIFLRELRVRFECFVTRYCI